MSIHVVLLGCSHRVAPLEERERLAIRDGEEADTVVALCAEPGIDEAVVISTCNRVELVAAGPDIEVVRASLRAFVARRVGVNAAWFEKFTYERVGTEAVQHLLRVTSSLDSLVLGEPQIVGQVKKAYATASEAGGTGTALNRLFHHAFKTAKRVRNETAIAENAVSVSYAAVELAKKVFADLRGRSVLVIGAGKMGGLAVKHLVAAGATQVHIMNRTHARAVEMARRLGGIAHEASDLERLLGDVDIVISSTGSQDYVIKHDVAKRAVSKRMYRPLFLIDIAVPRDIDPRCDGLSNVYLFDVDDLEKVVESNLRARQAEAAKAEEIVRRETAELSVRFAEASVVPTIVGLREKLTSMKVAEIEKLRRANPELPPEAIDAAARMAHALINKILHEPTLSLRRSSATQHHKLLVLAVRSLFDLGSETDTAEADVPPALPRRA